MNLFNDMDNKNQAFGPSCVCLVYTAWIGRRLDLHRLVVPSCSVGGFYVLQKPLRQSSCRRYISVI